MDKLNFIAEFLLKNEIMDGEQFTAAMEGTPTFEELEEMTEAKKRRSREENEERRRKEAAEKKHKEEEANADNSETEAGSADDDKSDRKDGDGTVSNGGDNEVPF